MNTNRVAIPGVLVLTMILMIQMMPTLVSIPSARADGGTNIDIFAYTNSTLDLNVHCTMKNGTIQIWYNGVNLIEEMHQEELAHARLKEAFTAFIAYNAGSQDVKDLKKALEAFRNTTYQNLDQLYYQDWLLTHFTGLNPANSSIAITILSGNSTVIDEIDVNRLKVLELENNVIILTNDLNATKEVIDEVITSIELELQSLEQDVSKEIDIRQSTDQQLQINIGTLETMIDKSLVTLTQNIETVGLTVGSMLVVLAIVIFALYSKMSNKAQELESFKGDLFEYVPDIATQIENGKAEEAARLEAEHKAQEEAAKAEAERRAKKAAEAEEQRKAEEAKIAEPRRARLREKGLFPCPHCDKVAFNKAALARHIKKEHSEEETHPYEPETEAE